jgi:hypothetical protein
MCRKKRSLAVERVDVIPAEPGGYVRGDFVVSYLREPRRWMMQRIREPHQEQPEPQPVPGYEPPRIEVVLTAEALGREGLYAGATAPMTL